MKTHWIPTARKLEFRIFRYNPYDKESLPHFQTYEVAEADSMTLFLALQFIRENLDASLQFDFVCRAGICGSCSMVINGKPTLACRTLTKNLPDIITLAPLPGFELIGDLSINTGKWMRDMSERVETWVHNNDQVNLAALEAKMEPEIAEKIYELERCVECGCCVSACATAQMRPDFVSAVAINQLARFRLDPRDNRTDAAYYEVLGSEDGVFGCMTLLGCEDNCPKQLPLAEQIAFMRRKMVVQGVKNT